MTDRRRHILTGSDTMVVMGRKAVRKGDLVSCPLPGHGVNPIMRRQWRC